MIVNNKMKRVVSRLKRFNSKGQEGWTLVNLLIALAVLVVIVLGIYYFVQQGEAIGENIPTQVEFVTQGCNLVDSEVLKESYCNQIRLIGKDKYVTCDYGFDNEGLILENGISMRGKCDLNKQASRIKTQILDRGLKLNAYVNGKLVSSYPAEAPKP